MLNASSTWLYFPYGSQFVNFKGARNEINSRWDYKKVDLAYSIPTKYGLNLKKWSIIYKNREKYKSNYDKIRNKVENEFRFICS